MGLESKIGQKLRPVGPWTDGRTYGRTYVRTYVRTENLPILQDFVPYRGRCPATAQLQPKNYIKRGKGTADHMMPLGDWLSSKMHVSGMFWNLLFKICNFRL